MATSTTEDYVNYSAIQTQFYTIAGPVLIALGIVGAILNCCTFTQKSLRQSPCAVYFIAYSIANFLSVLFGLLPPVLLYSVNIDPSSYNEIYCKIRFYMSIVPPILSPIYLLLASTDRTFVTSRNARTRQRSTHRLAYWSIAVATVTALLFYIHILIRVHIIEFFPGFSFCYYDDSAYGTFFVYSALLIGLLLPFLMSIFAVLTLKNIRKVHIHPIVNIRTGISNQISKDRQLAIMLLSEIFIYMLFTIIQPIVSLYSQITKSQTKTTQQQSLEYFLAGVAFLLSYIPVSINFYINLIVSKTFRRNITKMLLKMRVFRPVERDEAPFTRSMVITNRAFEQ